MAAGMWEITMKPAKTRKQNIVKIGRNGGSRVIPVTRFLPLGWEVVQIEIVEDGENIKVIKIHKVA